MTRLSSFSTPGAIRARIRKMDGQRVTISRAAQEIGAAANRKRAIDRATELAPTLAGIRGAGATTLREIAAGLTLTTRGKGNWGPVQVRRTLDALND